MASEPRRKGNGIETAGGRKARVRSEEGAALEVQAFGVGAGAAAGAVLGRILGGGARGAVIGAALGAAAGTALSVGTRRSSARSRTSSRPPRRDPGSGSRTDRDEPAGATAPEPLEGWTRARLYEVAKRLDIAGRSRMSKAELVRALRRHPGFSPG